MDSVSIAANAEVATNPHPMSQGMPSTEHHLIMDRDGIPVTFILNGTTVRDGMPFEASINAVDLREADSDADQVPTRPKITGSPAGPAPVSKSTIGGYKKPIHPFFDQRLHVDDLSASLR